MIIDSHQHVFWHSRDDAGLVEDMDTHGIGRAWLLTWEIPHHPIGPESMAFNKTLNPARVRSDGTHPGIILDDLIIAHGNHPGRFVLGYCPNPALPSAPDLFETACEMYGVRVCGEWKFRMLIDDPRSLELFHAAGRRNAPVVLHLDVPYLPPLGGSYQDRWFGGTVDNLSRALEACPETTFVGHAPGFWREICGDADTSEDPYPRGPVQPGGRLEKLLERYPNLMADLSAGSALTALKRDPIFSAELLTRFSDRFLFGRDYYGGDLMTFLETLNLPDETREAIFWQNAERLVPSEDSAQPSSF